MVNLFLTYSLIGDNHHFEDIKMNSAIELLNTELELLTGGFPGAEYPPQCFVHMKAEYLEYESRTMLKISFPVLPEFTNPMKSMQGGFITAAFDNVIGPLSYLSARVPCTSLDIHTNYIRPISPGDHLIITAKVVTRGRLSLHITAEAVNAKGKLIATCGSHLIALK